VRLTATPVLYPKFSGALAEFVQLASCTPLGVRHDEA